MRTQTRTRRAEQPRRYIGGMRYQGFREMGLRDFYDRLEKSTEMAINPESSRLERVLSRQDLEASSELLVGIHTIEEDCGPEEAFGASWWPDSDG